MRRGTGWARWWVGCAACAALVLVGAAAWAQQVGLGYKLRDHVHVGEQPAVILQASEDLDSLVLSLKRSDGKTIQLKHKKAAAGEPIELKFAQPEGQFGYEATATVVTRAGVQTQMSFQFEASVSKQLELKLRRDLSDLDARTLALTANAPLGKAELDVEDAKGARVHQDLDLSSVKPGEPIKLTWQGAQGSEVKRIEIKVFDKAGFWVGLELIPFSVSIPHEEVVFDSGKSTFQASEQKKLDATLKLLQAELDKYGSDLEINLYIAGYTDTVGSKESNLALSGARARARGHYFRGKGLSIPIYAQGFGEDVPAVQTGDEVDEPRNRRALYILSNFSPPKSYHVPRLDWQGL